MSKHTCEVVNVKLWSHPNADSLSIVPVWGWQVVVKTEEWKDTCKGVYIPPDSIVPPTDMFAFLYRDGFQSSKCPGRVRVRKFRGEISQGLLMPLPPGRDDPVGYDFAKEWGIEHYEPGVGGAERPIPPWYVRLFDALMSWNKMYRKLRRIGRKQDRHDQPVVGPKIAGIREYDVENFQRFHYAIEPGELVYITEKIHGSNARFVWHNGKLHVGSRRQWKRYHPRNNWWRAVDRNPWIKAWCQDHPDNVLYGEIFGPVQELHYGAQGDDMFFLAFDVLREGEWLEWEEFSSVLLPEHRVPVLYVGPFDLDVARGLSELDSHYAFQRHNVRQMGEGVVITTCRERSVRGLGRVQLKIVSNRYLEKS